MLGALERDPGAGTGAGTGFLARKPWSVATLLRSVADLLAGRFAACTVRGEISGFARASSGHCYFTLKDTDTPGATLRCAMFRRAATLLAFDPHDGQRVDVRGRLGLYEPRGELQLVAESMRPAGLGALYEQFLQSKARLEALGLFDAARKRPLPRHPRTVGLVTSLDAAALHDVVVALARRAPHVGVVVYPSPVQGSAAPEALAEAIALASRRAEVEVLLVCRGGGSLEDLWAFNDERVVRAIVGAGMPVVAGIGHETDVTLADFAADLRAPTPTAAAELVAPARAATVEALDALEIALGSRVGTYLDAAAQRLDRAALRLARPSQAVRRHEQRLALLAQRFGNRLPTIVGQRRVRFEQAAEALRRGAAGRLARERGRIDTLAARLEAVSPARVLARGYAWLSDAAERPVTSVERLAPGVRVRATLRDGHAELSVVGPPAAANAPAAIEAAATDRGRS